MKSFVPTLPMWIKLPWQVHLKMTGIISHLHLCRGVCTHNLVSPSNTMFTNSQSFTYNLIFIFRFSGETLSFSKDDSWSLSNKPQKRKMENFADWYSFGFIFNWSLKYSLMFSNTRKQLITEERISADLSQLSINTISSTSADHLEHLR